MARDKAPNLVDVQVGARVRARRVAQSISQEKLGEALGVSFQQIQKYEKGINRISASKLEAIARFLAVPVSYFFEDDARASYGKGFDDTSGQQPSLGSLPVPGDPEAEDLARAFSQVKDPKVRKRIRDLVDALIAAESPPRSG